MSIKRSIFIAGYCASPQRTRRSASEDLAEYLRTQGWSVFESSCARSPRERVMATLIALVLRCPRYRLLMVCLYSGRAFLWGLAACLLATFLRKPYVLTLHGGLLPEFARKRPWVVRRLFRNASLVIAPSEYLRRHLSWARVDISVIPNAIDVQKYTFRERKVALPSLIWIRAFDPLYNPELAIKVIAELHSEIPNIQLTMIGEEVSRDLLLALRKLACSLGLERAVNFVLGVPHTEVSLRLQRADIFLNTTTADNFPASVLEAMACGLCVVSTNAGGVPDMLEPHVDSLVTPCDDSRAISAAVRRLLTEPGLAHKLSLNARKTAERLDWRRCGSEWVDALSNSRAERGPALGASFRL